MTATRRDTPGNNTAGNKKNNNEERSQEEEGMERMTAEQAKNLLQRHGIVMPVAEVEKIMHLLHLLAEIVVAQYLRGEAYEAKIISNFG